MKLHWCPLQWDLYKSRDRNSKDMVKIAFKGKKWLMWYHDEGLLENKEIFNSTTQSTFLSFTIDHLYSGGNSDPFWFTKTILFHVWEQVISPLLENWQASVSARTGKWYIIESHYESNEKYQLRKINGYPWGKLNEWRKYGQDSHQWEEL